MHAYISIHRCYVAFWHILIHRSVSTRFAAYALEEYHIGARKGRKEGRLHHSSRLGLIRKHSCLFKGVLMTNALEFEQH